MTPGRGSLRRWSDCVRRVVFAAGDWFRRVTAGEFEPMAATRLFLLETAGDGFGILRLLS